MLNEISTIRLTTHLYADIFIFSAAVIKKEKRNYAFFVTLLLVFVQNIHKISLSE